MAASNPAYERFVLQERERLGPEHPAFLTQYCLRPLPGQGRLLTPSQLSQLQGTHESLAAARPGEEYVAGLDVGGAASEPGLEAGHDATVLSIGRLVYPPAGAPDSLPALEVVRLYAWQGAPHEVLHGALVSLLQATWRVRRVVVDATGVGEPVASFLERRLGRGLVQALKLSAPAKSSLGFELLAAVNGGRLRLFADDASAERQQCLRQLDLYRAVLRANQTLAFHVEPRDGHDDYVISLALLVAAAATASPRRARGRVAESFD